jgi:hypothetical protein
MRIQSQKNRQGANRGTLPLQGRSIPVSAKIIYMADYMADRRPKDSLVPEGDDSAKFAWLCDNIQTREDWKLLLAFVDKLRQGE